MREPLKAGLVQAGALGLVGLVVGALAGWVVVFSGADPTAGAANAARVYTLLVVLLPLALLGLTALYRRELGALHASLPAAVPMLVLAGLGGAVLASLVFFVPATNLPAIFAGREPVGLRQTLLSAVGWGRVLLVVAATTLCALALAVWSWARERA